MLDKYVTQYRYLEPVIYIRNSTWARSAFAKIERTKTEIKKLYSDPKSSIDLVKLQRWAAVQVVKVFLGIPIVPGK